MIKKREHIVVGISNRLYEDIGSKVGFRLNFALHNVLSDSLWFAFRMQLITNVRNTIDKRL